jgi:hypothetical protein
MIEYEGETTQEWLDLCWMADASPYIEDKQVLKTLLNYYPEGTVELCLSVMDA